MRAILVAALLFGSAHACELPDIALPTAAEPDLSRTMEVLGALVVASKNDAARATGDLSLLGMELLSLRSGDPRPVVAPVLPLAARLRELDCLALDGAPPPAKAYAAIGEDAGKLIIKLSNAEPPPPPAPPPPPPAPPPVVVIAPPPPPPPPPPPVVLPPLAKPPLVDPRRAARGLLRVGYAFFAVAGGLMTIATGLVIDGSVNTCHSCFLDPHGFEVGLGTGLFILGGLALGGATSFMIAGHVEFRKLRLHPTASVDKNGGFLGLRGNF
jgi:hypothetical protein